MLLLLLLPVFVFVFIYYWCCPLINFFSLSPLYLAIVRPLDSYSRKKCVRCLRLSYAEIVCFIRPSDADFVVSAVWAAFNDGFECEKRTYVSQKVVKWFNL